MKRRPWQIHCGVLKYILLQGPRDLEKYKASESLLKQFAIHLCFRFYKICWKCWNLRIETKKISAFFANVLWLLFFCEIFSTLLTFLCLNCLFHMNNHIYLVVFFMFVEIVSGWNVTPENIGKNSTKLFLVPGWSSQPFRHLLQNPN